MWPVCFVTMLPALVKILLIAGGGAVGALCRYGLAGVVQDRFGGSVFPWGTLVVNVLGCLAIGVLWVFVEDKPIFPPEMRDLLMVGLLGAFTTFSTFGLETVHLVADRQYLAAGANVAGSVILGLAAVLAGIALARAV